MGICCPSRATGVYVVGGPVMIRNRDFAYVFSLGGNIGISENEFRQKKLVPAVGDTRSYELLNSLKFAAFAASHDLALRKWLMHCDEHGDTYLIVDAFDVDAKVYVICDVRQCIILDIVFEDSPAPP